MNTSNGFFRWLWLLAILLPALGQSHAELVTPDDLKSALYDVLSHGNLFDAAYLSDRLGIGLHIVRLKALDASTAKFEGTQTEFEGTPTASPPALYGSIEYYADVDEARQRSTAHLSLGARSCVSLRQWGAEWHIQTSAGMSTDGGPSYESLVWPGSEGISLMVIAGRVGCGIEMSQTVGRVISVPVSADLPRTPAGTLSKQIADLLLSDLRDFVQVGRILNTEFVVEPDSQRNGLLYSGNPFPARVIPGFKSYVYYDGNDNGWYRPAAFFARSLHITDRGVGLSLTADKEVLCLSQAQLATELGQRDRRIRRERSVGPDETLYSVRGANLVSVSVTFDDGCATALRFHQVTDLKQSLGDPIRFTPANSLDRSTGYLNDDAQRRINLLAFRLRGVSLGGVEIEEMPGKHPQVAVTQDLARLKQLVNEALQRKGVTAQGQAKNNDSGECSLRQQPEDPAVCVDVWQ